MKIKQILGTALVTAALVGFTAPVLANEGGGTKSCSPTVWCPCGVSVSHQTIDHGKCGNGKCKGNCKGNKGQKNKGNSQKTS